MTGPTSRRSSIRLVTSILCFVSIVAGGVAVGASPALAAAPVITAFTPISGPAQTYNATQMIALINAIMAARAAFQANYNSKTTALAATVTIAAVVAFDVTTGW